MLFTLDWLIKIMIAEMNHWRRLSSNTNNVDNEAEWPEFIEFLKPCTVTFPFSPL